MLNANHLQHYPLGGENALRVQDPNGDIAQILGISRLDPFVKISNDTTPDDTLVRVMHQDGKNKLNCDFATWGISQIKPLLRPMSEIFNDKEILDEMSDNQIEQFRAFGNVDNLPFGAIRKCFDNHYDVFCLHEKGLAIDINTIKP